MSNQHDVEVSRRDLLRTIGTSVVLTTSGAGVLTPALAQHVHQALTEEKSLSGGSEYKPKFLTPQEFQTLRRLAELIMPADEHSKGALDAGAPEFIDFLCSRSSDLASIYTGGLAWIDRDMQRRFSKTFRDAKPAQQTALLDVIAFRKNDSPETGPGIQFFIWVRHMVVDAFYTSPVGIKDIGFMGNGVLSSFSVPDEAVQYAMKRSPFGS
ncbi:MAG: gluconate 2-dehydrogenase subunit 3 family protein [Acidobacteriota bacterium]|nr:gluconate 2-dehydrogenase subunit 3 family protein [Acidobacteriota bacterium]